MIQVWLFSFCSIGAMSGGLLTQSYHLFLAENVFKMLPFHSLIITIWLILNPLASVTSWECCL